MSCKANYSASNGKPKSSKGENLLLGGKAPGRGLQTATSPSQQGSSANLAEIIKGQSRIMNASTDKERSTALSGGLDPSPSGEVSTASSSEGAKGVSRNSVFATSTEVAPGTSSLISRSISNIIGGDPELPKFARDGDCVLVEYKDGSREWLCAKNVENLLDHKKEGCLYCKKRVTDKNGKKIKCRFKSTPYGKNVCFRHAKGGDCTRENCKHLHFRIVDQEPFDSDPSNFPELICQPCFDERETWNVQVDSAESLPIRNDDGSVLWQNEGSSFADTTRRSPEKVLGVVSSSTMKEMMDRNDRKKTMVCKYFFEERECKHCRKNKCTFAKNPDLIQPELAKECLDKILSNPNDPEVWTRHYFGLTKLHTDSDGYVVSTWFQEVFLAVYKCLESNKEFIKIDKADNHELVGDFSDNVNDFYHLLTLWSNRTTRARRQQQGKTPSPTGYSPETVPSFALYPEGPNCHRENIVWYFILAMSECREKKCCYGPNCRKGIHLPKVDFLDLTRKVSSEEMTLKDALAVVSSAVSRKGVINVSVVAGSISIEEAQRKNENLFKSSLDSFKEAVSIQQSIKAIKGKDETEMLSIDVNTQLGELNKKLNRAVRCISRSSTDYVLCAKPLKPFSQTKPTEVYVPTEADFCDLKDNRSEEEIQLARRKNIEKKAKATIVMWWRKLPSVVSFYERRRETLDIYLRLNRYINRCRRLREFRFKRDRYLRKEIMASVREEHERQLRDLEEKWINLDQVPCGLEVGEDGQKYQVFRVDVNCPVKNTFASAWAWFNKIPKQNDFRFLSMDWRKIVESDVLSEIVQSKISQAPSRTPFSVVLAWLFELSRRNDVWQRFLKSDTTFCGFISNQMNSKILALVYQHDTPFSRAFEFYDSGADRVMTFEEYDGLPVNKNIRFSIIKLFRNFSNQLSLNGFNLQTLVDEFYHNHRRNLVEWLTHHPQSSYKHFERITRLALANSNEAVTTRTIYPTDLTFAEYNGLSDCEIVTNGDDSFWVVRDADPKTFVVIPTEDEQGSFDEISRLHENLDSDDIDGLERSLAIVSDHYTVGSLIIQANTQVKALDARKVRKVRVDPKTGKLSSRKAERKARKLEAKKEKKAKAKAREKAAKNKAKEKVAKAKKKARAKGKKVYDDSDSDSDSSDFDSDSDSDSEDGSSKFGIKDNNLFGLLKSSKDSDSESDSDGEDEPSFDSHFPSNFTIGEEELDECDESVRRFTLSVKVINKVSRWVYGPFSKEEAHKFAGIVTKVEKNSKKLFARGGIKAYKESSGDDFVVTVPSPKKAESNKDFSSSLKYAYAEASNKMELPFGPDNISDTMSLFFEVDTSDFFG